MFIFIPQSALKIQRLLNILKRSLYLCVGLNTYPFVNYAIHRNTAHCFIEKVSLTSRAVIARKLVSGSNIDNNFKHFLSAFHFASSNRAAENSTK